MKNKVRERIAEIFILLIIGIVLICTIVRLFYGAELSDEAYAVAETYMVSRGALPFVNNWSQMPGFTLLLAPFIKLYTLIAGGTDGIFLYFRFLSFFINLLTAVTVAYLLGKRIKNRIMPALFSLIYVGASGWDYVVAFRGDRLAVNLLAVGGLLIAIYFSDNQDKLKIPFISGILLALSVLSYPTFVIEFVFFVIAIIYLCFKRKRGYKILLCFLAGAAMAAVIVVGYLAVNSSVSDIIQGIQYLLKNVIYFQLENDGAGKLSGYVKDMMHQVIFLVILSAGCFVVIGCLFLKKWLFRINVDYDARYASVKRAALVSIVSGVCLYHLFQIGRFKTEGYENITLYAMTIETFAVLFVWCFIKFEKRLCRYFMGFIWFPTYIGVIITGVGTYNSILARHLLLRNAAYLLVVFVFFAVNDTFNLSANIKEGNEKQQDIYSVRYSLFSGIIPIVLMMVITFTYLFNGYTYVYRDESLRCLNTVVSEGPYKGMRTTEERANGLIELGNIIGQYVNEEDYVLAMDNDPFIYLMSEGKICTPSTWDMALYSYGFDQPDLYYDYFSVMNTEPTKIIYFNYGRDEVMSIDVDYKFNDYVNSNYHKIYENRNLFEWSYEHKNLMCELIIFERN